MVRSISESVSISKVIPPVRPPPIRPVKAIVIGIIKRAVVAPFPIGIGKTIGTVPPSKGLIIPPIRIAPGVVIPVKPEVRGKVSGVIDDINFCFLG
jgi:hypothetical protein